MEQLLSLGKKKIAVILVLTLSLGIISVMYQKEREKKIAKQAVMMAIVELENREMTQYKNEVESTLRVLVSLEKYMDNINDIWKTNKYLGDTLSSSNRKEILKNIDEYNKIGVPFYKEYNEKLNMVKDGELKDLCIKSKKVIGNMNDLVMEISDSVEEDKDPAFISIISSENTKYRKEADKLKDELEGICKKWNKK